MLKSGLPVDWDDAVRRVRSSTKVTEGFAFIGEIIVIWKGLLFCSFKVMLPTLSGQPGLTVT